MSSARKIGAWFTLLLFIGGLFAPRLLAATRTDCPMMRAAQEKLSATVSKPSSETPACCPKHKSEIVRARSFSGRCCCDMTAAPERTETPAILTVATEPLALVASPVAMLFPNIIRIQSTAIATANETTPRAPPLRTSSPRAPPQF